MIRYSSAGVDLVATRYVQLWICVVGHQRELVGKIEYDYLGFGSRPLNFTTPLLGTVTSNASLNVQEIKAGVNFRFGGP